jgi:bifunctional non-homologous end joining protein LigD
VPSSLYIVPSQPVLKSRPPTGERWIHEIKFDGWRAQLQKQGDNATILSKGGHDFTRRFAELRDSIRCLPVQSAIIDAEITACDRNGMPDFGALMAGAQHGLCAWCFDIMQIAGKDLRSRPLLERRIYLRHLLAKADDDFLRYSEEFDDAERLLATAARMGLEGIVSKLADQPYRSGKNPGWIKVKTAAWREANRDRWEMFERR